MSTFGGELKRLANTADALREDQLQRVYDATCAYAARELRVTKIELLEEAEVDHRLGLQPRLDRNDRYGAYRLRSDDDQPRGLNAFAFLEQTPLWVTTPEAMDDRTSLSDLGPDDLVELWSRRGVPVKFEQIEAASRSHYPGERTVICRMKPAPRLPVPSIPTACSPP